MMEMFIFWNRPEEKEMAKAKASYAFPTSKVGVDEVIPVEIGIQLMIWIPSMKLGKKWVDTLGLGVNFYIFHIFSTNLLFEMKNENVQLSKSASKRGLICS